MKLKKLLKKYWELTSVKEEKKYLCIDCLKKKDENLKKEVRDILEKNKDKKKFKFEKKECLICKKIKKCYILLLN